MYRGLLQILRALHDARAYFLILPFAFLMWMIDPVIAETWLQWAIALPIICGVMILIRKIVFNTLDLSAAISKACETSTGSGYVVIAISIFCSTFLLAATLWLSH